MAYTPTGPFVNGTAPGVGAPFLNAVEAQLVALNTVSQDASLSSSGGILTMLGLVNNDAGITIAGTTAGSATLYQFLRGNVKGVYIYYNGYRNSTTTEQRITLPQAFTRTALIYAAGGSPPTHFWLAGSSLTGKISTVNALPVPPGAGSASSGQNLIDGLDMGEVQSGFDQIGLGISLGKNYTTSLFIIGS